jgi:hypothetical protein
VIGMDVVGMGKNHDRRPHRLQGYAGSRRSGPGHRTRARIDDVAVGRHVGVGVRRGVGSGARSSAPARACRCPVGEAEEVDVGARDAEAPGCRERLALTQPAVGEIVGLPGRPVSDWRTASGYPSPLVTNTTWTAACAAIMRCSRPLTAMVSSSGCGANTTTRAPADR